MNRFLVIVVFYMFFMSVFAEESANLLKNGDFEEELTGWTCPNWDKELLEPEIDNQIMQGAGMGSVRFVGKSGKHVSFMQQVKVDSNKTKYRVSGWIKIVGFENSWTARIQAICLYPENGQNKLKYYNLITPYNLHDIDWTKYTVEFEIPEGTLAIRVVLLTNPPNVKNMPNTGTVWFDNVALTFVEQKDASK